MQYTSSPTQTKPMCILSRCMHTVQGVRSSITLADHKIKHTSIKAVVSNVYVRSNKP